LSSKTSPSDSVGIVLPLRHVAIIMDGNGRWAKKRLLNRVMGHEKGAEAVRAIVRTSREINLPVLTLFAFSTENWQRPAAEVNALMGLLKRFLINEEPELKKNNIRLGVIGQYARLPEEMRAIIKQVQASTAGNDGLLLNLALSYGSRAEITEAVRAIAEKVAAGALNPDDIDEALVAGHLYTHNIPDPDLLIRTSGEMRVSNFLLWQLAYTELAISPTLWPDFTPEEFLRILDEYRQRRRRFGKVDPQQ
jgi:undecaprenyl diphosphate synthase